MEPQENKQLALQKAISSHEQAEAAIADLLTEGEEATHTALLERIRANLAELRAAAQNTSPSDTV